jgi:RNA polymerase sigma factor (sigma-70 family)
MDNRSLRPVLRCIRRLSGSQPAADHDLLDSFRGRQDEDAFAALVERHGPLVLGVCRRVLHNEHDAEDAFQSTFLVLARKAGSIRQRESLGSWLYRVAYHLSLKLRTRLGRAPGVELQLEPTVAADPAQELSWAEVRQVLDEEMIRLPEKYQAPLVLCYLSGKTRDEAAEQLGWSVGTLKGRLERGRDLLRARLARRGLTLSAALLASMLAAGQTSAVPLALASATAKAATAFAAGAAPGTTAQVLALAELGLQSAAPGKVKLLAALVSLATLIGVGTSIVLPSPSAEPGAQPVAAADPAAAQQPPQPQGPPFINITKESGIEAIVNDKYAASPKWWLAGLHLVDLDADGHLDLFLSAHGGGGAVAALNDGKGKFALAQGSYPPTEIHLAADIDEDGKADLTMTFQDGGGKWWLNRSRPGQLSFEGTRIERGTNTARRQALIDINRDGKVDWLRGTPSAVIFEFGDGKGSFTNNSAALKTGNTGRAESLCLPADIDGDGFIDLLAEWGHYENSKGTSRLFRNDGKMDFIDITRDAGLPETGLSIKGVGDVDRDGDLDLLVLEDRKPELYLNDGKGKFTRKPGAFTGMETATRPTYASWGFAVVVDIDNDGIPDIIWNGKHFLWILRGLGDGRFQYMNRDWGIRDVAASSVDDGLCFGDIDGDGMLDIVGYITAGDPRRVAVYRNNLPRQNWVRVRPIGAAGNRCAAGARIRLHPAEVSNPPALLAFEQVVIADSQAAQSYYGLGQTERHFGLGKRDAVDVVVEFYPSGKSVRVTNVRANTTVTVREDDAK